MTTTLARDLDEAGVVRLAELLALQIRRGEVITLRGDVGAGKTTLARALITALLGDRAAEVPSPTFSLAQHYETPRLSVTHFDFYRLASPDEARELGFDEAIASGAAIVEWPERAPELMPASRCEIELAETGDAARRQVTLRGLGDAATKVARIGEVMAFLDGQPRWRNARITYLQGDASTRSYARLFRGSDTIVLMDAPRQSDGPLTPAARAYSRIARLADDMRPYVAIAGALRGAGLSAPPILQQDRERRFFEACWMHEYRGTYYLSYSTGDTHLLVYATGDNPCGPFTYRGVILTPVVGWTTHHSILEYKGKWWMFYHDSTLSEGKTHLRSVKVRELRYRPDGSIETMEGLD